MTQDILGDYFQNMGDVYTKMFPCSRLFLCEIKDFLYVGDKVEIKDGKVIKATDTPTHEITALDGTLSGGSYQIKLNDIATNLETIIKL